MTVRGRPLTVTIACGGLALAAAYAAIVAAPIAWFVLLVSAPAGIALAVAAAAWIYFLLRATWRLWRRDPRGLGFARIVTWLAVVLGTLGLFGPSRTAAAWVALAIAVAVDICLYLPVTTREYKPAWWQLEGG